MDRERPHASDVPRDRIHLRREPIARPRYPFTLFRAAPPRARHGVSWSTDPKEAAEIGACYDDGSGPRSEVWSFQVPPDRLLGAVSSEDEFLLDLEGYEQRIQPAGPNPRAHRRTLKRIDRWIRAANPEFYAARKRWT